MDMNIVNLIIALVSGLVGGNIVGSASKDVNLGTAGNSVAGLVGGGLGNYLLQALNLLGTAGVAGAASAASPEATQAAAHAVSNFDIGSLITNIAGSGVGGAVLTAIVGIIKNSLNKG